VTGIRCLLMRGGTSKGAYFLAADLPGSYQDDLWPRVMGSPDPRQLDGIGGGHPLTSKVAVISPPSRDDADVDYLFLQVGVGEATVTDKQNCGNLLAGVAPFAIERGLVTDYPVRIHMVNSGEIATATPAGPDRYLLEFGPAGRAGGEPFSTGLIGTGLINTVLSGVPVTCVNAGMPVVVAAASDLGRTGYESVAELEADVDLAGLVQAIRLEAGPLMGLGDVNGTTVPKVSLVAPPRDGGMICTRTFIPVRVHEAIGVLGAISVATALLREDAAGHDLAVIAPGQTQFAIEHPSGRLDIEVRPGGRAGVIRPARKLFDGIVYPRETL
jgi:4-oxalomesaconate tautomerase